MKIDFINEPTCSMTMIPVLIGFSTHNQIKNEDNHIYSIEKRMRIDEKTRACDAIYSLKNRLPILEYKNNVTHKQDSIWYIMERGYTKHFINYLKSYEEHILERKTIISKIGIEFEKNKVTIKLGDDELIEDILNEICEDENMENKQIKDSFLKKKIAKISKKKIKQTKGLFKNKTIMKTKIGNPTNVNNVQIGTINFSSIPKENFIKTIKLNDNQKFINNYLFKTVKIETKSNNMIETFDYL